MSTASSLALRALLKQAVAKSHLTPKAPGLEGLTPQAKALAVAAAAHAQAEQPVLYVIPSDADIDAAVDDIRFFLSTIEGLTEAAALAGVLPCPSLQTDPYRALAPHMRTTAARARALLALASGAARVIVASAAALLPRVPPPEALVARALGVQPGLDVDPQAIVTILTEGGYERQDPVDTHGEFSLRGGILDVYPPGETWPIRLEFFGDTVESIRRFDPGTQRSIETLDRFLITPVRESQAAEPTDDSVSPQATIFDYTSGGRAARLLVSEATEVHEALRRLADQVSISYEDAQVRQPGLALPAPDTLIASADEVSRHIGRAISLESLAVDGPAALSHVPSQPTADYRGRLADWVTDVRQARERGDAVVFVCGTSGRAERTIELLRDYEVRAQPAGRSDDPGAVLVAVGSLSRGLRLPDASLTLFAEADIFEEERRQGARRRRSAAATFLSDLRDLKVGDLIVHVDHGIGRFVGLKALGVGASGEPQEFLELHYHGDAKLFVPVERLDLVQKYSGGASPPLDRLGGTTWAKAKTRVRKAMRDMAEELLKLYASRKAVPGHGFAADTHWQEEFESAFPHELTPDQASAVADIKRDMEGVTPMDRLLCGDVGYGKTEVAMRAAFKAVMDGKQVAVLAPTTVLAFQHLETFTRRFATFPVSIDMVSRFRSTQEQKATLERLAAGQLDVIIGTHRLLSKDVVFRDLGLLIVDEEQRFGVTHKERIKQMRRKVDVLTLSATPIPRTLNMSLVGIRDMSVIETPPKDRLSIQTHVVKFDQGVIATALRTEMARGGQVFFVHNRVESIHSMANLLQRLVPEARVVVGHGQMGEDALEQTMLDFMAHKYDVLLATTIIENGLDIPNANTIVINRADRYGLSQLYQLRGRVGRSDRPAYAYLLIPPEESLSAVAKKRLSAIREFSDLGSGFRIAALDLEIRGAGNLLGGQQSGHIDAVGFEMYMKLLEETIRELKGEDLEDELRSTVNLKVDFRIDEAYVPDMNQRLSIYRRIASARSEDDLARILDDVRDRYGAPPPAVLNLADYGRVRVLADALGVETIDREGPLVAVRFREKARIDPDRLIALVRRRDDLQLQPPATLRLRLGSIPAGGSTRRAAGWWTARARADVMPGFTKAELTRTTADDPRAEGGLLDQVTGLLLALGGGA